MIDDFPPEWLLYLRKSVGYAGIARQRAATTAMIERRGGKVVDGGEFNDADRTAWRNTHRDLDAALPPRPGFDALLAAMAARPGVGVAAWHADRLGRDPEAGEILIRACRRDGGHLIATKAGGDYDVTTSNGRSHLRADVNAANDEVDHNVERMLEAKAEAAAEGRWLGGPRPFGWTAVDGELELHDAEADAIRAACSDVLAGTSTYSITAAWRAMGLTGTRGAVFTPSDVRAILLRPRNAGLMEHRGQVTGKAQWPAIVDEATWRSVCTLLTSPGRRTTPGPAPRHLLCGIALCGTCGAPMTIKSRGAGHDPAYRCSLAARMLPRRPGPHAGRHAPSLDALAAYLAKERLKRDDARLLLHEDHAADRVALLDRDAALKAEREEQWDLYRAKVITARELAEGRAALDAGRQDVAAQLAALDQADVLAPMLDDPEARWEAAPLERRQAVVSALMHITVWPAPAGIGPVGFDPDLVDVRWVRRLPSDG